MLKDITIGQYFPGHSVVHRMDPRMKLILTIFYIVILFVVSNPFGFIPSVLFLMGAYMVSRIPLKMIARSIKPILPIILFTSILNLFFISGESVIFEIGPDSYDLAGGLYRCPDGAAAGAADRRDFAYDLYNLAHFPDRRD